ncbi:MAG TPA: phosphotransferase [Solirubrobacteraceae bacterium]|nr:phosphotransferase [Solirubrobacteraceae bacterium]
MSTSTPPRGRGRSALRAARRRIDTPLYRNGYSLVAGSALTSGIGLLYWLVAARAYSTAAVGIGSALISASATIANLGHLNLKSALNRFLPRAGALTERLVTRSYLIAAVVSGAASAVFVVGIGLWAPALGVVSTPLLGAGFVLATIAGTIFVLEDSVLTGIRRAHWVPLENLVYSILKLAALPAVVLVMPRLGTFVSWTATMPPLILAVNWLLFRRLLPAHARATERDAEPVDAPAIARYVAADFSAYVIMTATMGLLPVVVLSTLGAKASAYYFIAWSIGYGLYLIPSGMGMSMISEAAADPDGLAGYDRQTLLEGAKLLVPCVLVTLVGAPWLLGLLGAGYARGATDLLRLLALSALPWMVFVSYTNSARVRRRMRNVVRAAVALFGLVVAIGVPLLRPLGVDGLGVGWLAAQTIVAAGILVAPRLRRRGGLDAAVRMLSAARTGWRRLRRGRLDRALRSMLIELAPPERPWVVQRRVSALNDVAITLVGPAGSDPAAVVKSTRATAGQGSLWPHAHALRELARVDELSDWRSLVPREIAGGIVGRGAYLVESWLPGATMDALLRTGMPPGELLDPAAQTIARLHAATARADRFDDALMAELVDGPLERLRSVMALRVGRAGGERLARLERELRAPAGLRVATAWVHGDLSPGNILFAPDGAVSGIVDWERGRARGLPQLDLLQLLISTRTAVEAKDFGRVVAELRGERGWRPHERGLVAGLGGPLAPDALVLLTWLNHIAANLEKSSRYRHNPLFVRRNVDPVLRTLAELPPARVPRARRPLARAPHIRRPLSRPPRVRTPLIRGPRIPDPLARMRAWLADHVTAAVTAALCLACALWGVSLPQIDPRAMNDFGLLSVLPATFVLSLVLLTVSFMTLVLRRAARPWLLVAHLLALVLVVHATPEIVYGTLRYTWAYKHVGIVDYILRHGGVDPSIAPLFQPVYHDWPGFFALVAMLARLAGLHTVLSLAGWGPVFNNVMYLPALVFLFGGLTRDRRVVWLGCWVFYVANWVGQDYFSPQGFALLLYLLLTGVVVRWLRPGADVRWGAARRSGLVSRARRPGAPAGPSATAATLLAVGLLAAIVVSHALTATMACLALVALALSGVRSARRLAVIAAAMTAAWDLTFAWPFAGRNLAATVATVHLPWETTAANLAGAALDRDQLLVADVSRLVTVAVFALAAAGAVRLWRAGRLDRALAALAVAPVFLFAAGNYDGEMLFRIDLFAVPFLSLLAAHALIGLPQRARAPVGTAVGLVVLGMFLFPYYGDERTNYVPPREVTAARWLDAHAVPGSLVVDATSCDELDSLDYEHFVCLPLSAQPAATARRLIADPVRNLVPWLAGSAYRRGYVFLSENQSMMVRELGALPRGSLGALERRLLASPRFRVLYRNRDAIVFTLAGSAGR